MEKVVAAVLAVVVVVGCVTAAGCNKQNNGSYSQTVNEKNDKDKSGDNGSKDNGGSYSNPSDESKIPDIPESPASDFNLNGQKVPRLFRRGRMSHINILLKTMRL